MENDTQDEVIVDDVEATNDGEVEETTEEKAPKEAEKPKRTPQEEYEYHVGRAKRLAKKHGFEDAKAEKPSNQASSDDVLPSKPNELDMGSIAYLNSMVGLKGKDEIALAREYISNGKSVLDLPENKFFKQDLQSLREAKESAAAIPKGKGRSGQTGITDVDLAVAKFNETGELPADFKTRNEVINAVTKKEATQLFQGPAVI